MNEDMMFFNKYYIRTREDGAIIRLFSDAFEPPQTNDILINDRGEGVQPRLVLGGRENPQDELWSHDILNPIPLLKWDGKKIIPRPQAEIQAERDAIPIPKPIASYEERLKALEDAMEVVIEALPDTAKEILLSMEPIGFMKSFAEQPKRGVV